MEAYILDMRRWKPTDSRRLMPTYSSRKDRSLRRLDIMEAYRLEKSACVCVFVRGLYPSCNINACLFSWLGTAGTTG